MATPAELMTAEQYFAVSTEGDRMQLVGGVMVLNEVGRYHQQVQLALLVELGNWIRASEGRGQAGGPIDVVVSEHDVYGPDVVWIAERHVPADPRAKLERIPDLCVEIRSPSTWRFDIGRKKAAYEAAGLPELWLVDDRSHTVLVFRRSQPDAPGFDVELELGPDEILSSPQLPGFELLVRRTQQLAVLLDGPAREAGLVPAMGEFNLGESDQDYRVPDGGLHRPGAAGVWLPTAALVVEIVSSGDETWEKLPFYAKHQVDEVLIVDPGDRSVRCLALSGGEYRAVERSGLIELGAADLADRIDWPAP